MNEIEMKIIELKMEESNKMLEWMADVAKIAFTSLLTINGAAIISLLTFLGNSKTIKHFSDLWFWSISSYCVGILFVILSITFAFWSQKLFREGLDSNIKQGKETDPIVINREGMCKRNYSITFSLLSLGCFFSGSIFALCALSKAF